jgi:uncharacterized membrane protein YfcA
MTSSFRYEIFIFFILTLIAEILGTLGGFGSSLFFVPLSQFFFDFQTVLALTGLLHVFSNTSKIVLFRKNIDWKVALWLGISSIVLAIIGAFLTRFVSLDYASIVLGLFLISFSTFLFSKPDFSIRSSIRNSIFGGGIAGFLAGFIGTGGAIRGLVLASFNLEKNIFVGTSAIIDFGVDFSRTIIYLEGGYFSMERIIYVPLLMVAAALGSYLGKIVLNKVDQERFKKITLGLIFLTGVTLIVQYLVKL